MLIRVLLLICLAAGCASAQSFRTAPRREGRAVKAVPRVRVVSDYAPLELNDFGARPDQYQGKLVSLTAEVISVDAKRQAIRVFDAPTKTLVGVSLSNLPKGQRRFLAFEPVRYVSVYGSVEALGDRYVIVAHKVVPVPAGPLAQGSPGRGVKVSYMP